MPWYTMQETQKRMRISERHVRRLITQKKLTTQVDDAGTMQIWIEETTPSPYLQGEGWGGVLDLPEINPSHLTDAVLAKMDAMMTSITQSISLDPSLPLIKGRDRGRGLVPRGTLARWKADLRQLYGLPDRASFSGIVSHPQIRQAIAYIVIRKKRNDVGELASARTLKILVKETGEMVPVQGNPSYLLSLYARPGHNAVSCYRALVTACNESRVINELDNQPITIEQLPSEATVSRWLRGQMKGSKALRASRMSRSEFIADDIYISRPKDEYRPGEKLEGDHTEDNILVYRNDGNIAPLWCTALVDVRTGMCKAYVLAYRPNGDTIGLAVKRACLGTQIEAAIHEDGAVKYVPANIVDAPDLIVYDNGKDYRSKYSGQVVGKIDLNDDARRMVRSFCKLHYTGKRHPQSKGTVEGWFAIIQNIMKYLPGFKGSNYQKKPDELKSQIDAGVLLTEDEYRKLFQMAVNTLNNRIQDELGKLSPVQFYLANQARFRVVDERTLNFLMMKWKRDAKISRGYIRMLGCEYFSMDLDDYNTRLAQLYYDPAEIGRVAVYVDGEFITFAVDKDLLGVTEKDWLVVMRERARKNREIREDIASIRNGMTLEEAKATLFHAEVSNVSPVSAAMLQKRTPLVVELTGIESEAKKFHEELDQQKRTEDVHKKRDDASKGPMRLINIERLK